MNAPTRDSSGKFAGKQPGTSQPPQTPARVSPDPQAVAAGGATVTPTALSQQPQAPDAPGRPVNDAGNAQGHSPGNGAASPGGDPGAPYGRRADGTPRAKPGAKPGTRQVRHRFNPEAPDLSGVTRTVAPPVDDAKYRELAAMCVTTCTGACEMLGPELWPPTKEEERKFLIDATAQYFKAKGIPDLPPGWVLLGAICVYVLPRVSSQNFQIFIAQKIAMLRGR